MLLFTTYMKPWHTDILIDTFPVNPEYTFLLQSHNLTNHLPLGTSLVITSEAFASKPLLARQRMVNTLLKEELAKEGGIHALQLKTRTPEEEEKLKAKEAEQS